MDQVRALFLSKGIPLDTDATPFVEALEDAFRREETIRAGAARAKRQIAKLRDDFRKVGRAYVDQLSQLRRLQTSLQEQSRRLRGKKRGQPRKGATRIAVQGDHRSLVTRTEREQLPMVPGPEEPQ